MGAECFVGVKHWIEPHFKHLCTWKLDCILLTLKCMTNKISLNDLKMVEHLLEENCVKIVENEETLSDGVV
jgi:hypothetical protein